MFLTDHQLKREFPLYAEAHYVYLFKHRFERVIKEKIRSLSNTKQRAFFQDLKSNDYQLLKRIVLCRPENMKRLVSTFNKYPKPVTRKKKALSKRFGDHVNDLFNYKWFCDKKSPYNAYHLAQKLGCNTCMYCNRNYTLTLQDKKGGIVRPEFDHFLPQSKYPFFAVSFYNLVPSCHICNSNLKLAKPFDLLKFLHPYKDSFDDTLKFTVFFNVNGVSRKKLTCYSDLINILYGDLNSFKIKLISRKFQTSSVVKKAKANAKIFHIEDFYNEHKDMVVEMIQNAVIYNETNINDLYEKYMGKLFNDKNDILRMVTRNYPNPQDLTKRVFSKLSKDIHKEFGIKY